MKKIFLLSAALAGIVLTSCTNDDFIGDVEVTNPTVPQEAPIMFSSSQSAFTRADFVGAEAAAKLNNKFVVTGFKGSETATPGKATEGIAGGIVFDNYLVEYAVNTANTTESNSDNWEYVGKGLIPHAVTNGITSQTIKYWDYTQSQYDFFAWSTGLKTAVYKDADLGAGKVLVTNIQPNSVNKTWTEAGSDPDVDPARIAYTFTGTAEDLKDCYITDIVTVNKTEEPGYGEVKGYNKPVVLKFRQLGTKVRIALYETVPGYSVKDVQFYSAAASNDANASAAKLFTTTANDIYTEGTYKIYFPTLDQPSKADNNQAHIKFTPKSGTDQTTVVDWGGLNYTGREQSEKSTDNVYLGRTSNTASFAGSTENFYQFFLPNESGTNLNLRVNYTLESIDGSGEVIYVKGATAQVPSIYTTWKPGYAYTYIFKISDKTNGHTGVYDPTHPDDTSVNSDPAGLYPITFDAIVVNAEEDAKQETITLVSTPSITTYQNGSNVVNNNEYTVISSSDPKITGEIYVTVNDGEIGYETVTTPPNGESLDGLYTYDSDNSKYVPATGTSDGTGEYYRMKPIVENGALATLTDKATLYKVAEGTTEAEVIDAMQMRDDDLFVDNTTVPATTSTITGRNKVALFEATGSNALTLTNQVTYGADGNTIGVGTAEAAKFVPEAGTTYAFVYTKQAAAVDGEAKYQPIAYNDATVTTKYRFKLDDIATAGDVQKGVVYFAPSGSTLAKKSVFIGQDVSNLYLRTGEEGSYTYTLATGYAKTTSPVTDYYYYVGTTPTKARNIAYADFNSTGTNQLYVKSGAYFIEKPTTETVPVDGTAYYYRTGSEGNYVYTYCVILPEQTATDWKTLDKTQYVEVSEDEITGMTYFDKYIKNNGVYYAKVIKVQ
jgi:hypothetical protein